MAGDRQSSRKKILAAAAEVARESGPGNVSLDAVAARAGVSKGGLLYNFPTKARLMQGLVEEYLAEFDKALEAAAGQSGGRGSLLAAFVRLVAQECDEGHASASWIFSAIAEDPDFLRPIKAFKRRLLDRLKADASGRAEDLLVTFLAVEGLRSMKLFDADVLTEEERRLVFSSLIGASEADADDASGGVRAEPHEIPA